MTAPLAPDPTDALQQLLAAMTAAPMAEPMAEPTAPAEDTTALRLVLLPDDDERAGVVKRAVGAVYGEQFPPLRNGAEQEQAWVSWADALWDQHAGPHLPRVRAAERNRLFRKGVQWLSAVAGGQWRVPPKPRDKVRAVVNMIGPALDWRLQVLTEQRPGVRARPLTGDPDDAKKAQANQAALEHAYAEQSLAAVLREAAFWAQTDGVAFLHPHWNPDVGPVVEGEMGRTAVGDVRTSVLPIEHVRVSANATAIERPHYWVVSEEIALADAILRYGAEVVDEGGGAGVMASSSGSSYSTNRAGAFGTDRTATGDASDGRLAGQQTVRKLTVYCEASPYLPNGLTCCVVGRKVVLLAGLLCGKVPLVPFRDGSPDPAFYPVPVMEQWLEAQTRLNAAYSLLLNNLRKNAGGRFLARANAIKPDTFTGESDTLIEVRSTAALGDVIQPLQGFSIGADALQTIQAEMQRLEQLTGYNDVARGGVSNMSGRAVLAIREQLERVFAPSVYAACEAVKGWAGVTLAWMAEFYELPRTIAALGKARPDLGRSLQRLDLDPAASVDLDPETMMPMPSSVRRAVLDDLLNRGGISWPEYRRRYGFAFLDELETPDRAHAARCQRFLDQLRTGQPPEPMLWQDDEAIWQDVLEREAILAPDVDPMVQASAIERWDALAQQALVKAGASPQMGAVPHHEAPMDPGRAALAPMPMQPGAMGAPLPGDAPDPAGAPAPIDPSMATTTAMPPGPLSAMATDPQQAATRFDAGALR